MILFLRALVWLFTFVLLVALAVVGLMVAVFSIQGGDGPLSLPGLAQHLQLPELRDLAGDYLDDLEGEGPTARLSALAGIAAVLTGILLLAGALGFRRERLIVLEEEGESKIAARRGALADAAEALAEQARGVSEAKVRIRPAKRLRPRGSLVVRASHPRREDAARVEERTRERLEPLAQPFELRTSVETRVGEGEARVQ